MKFQDILFLPCLLLQSSYVSSTVVVQNAPYEDLTDTPVVANPVGTYKDLIYNAWVVAGPTVPGVKVGGLASQSPPQSALTAADIQLANGTPSMMISKPYKSFSVLDFYFGCVVRTDEGSVGVATQCTITVAGFQAKNDKEVALASFTFTPPPKPLTQVPMIHAVLPSSFLQALNNVTIVQNPSAVALRIDNLHYTVST